MAHSRLSPICSAAPSGDFSARQTRSDASENRATARQDYFTKASRAGAARLRPAAHLDICEIRVDRADDHGFVLLTYDTTPGYTDTQAFPAAPVKWTYKAIYRVGDAQVGLWSLPVSVTVGA